MFACYWKAGCLLVWNGKSYKWGLWWQTLAFLQQKLNGRVAMATQNIVHTKRIFLPGRVNHVKFILGLGMAHQPDKCLWCHRHRLIPKVAVSSIGLQADYHNLCVYDFSHYLEVNVGIKPKFRPLSLCFTSFTINCFVIIQTPHSLWSDLLTPSQNKL